MDASPTAPTPRRGAARAVAVYGALAAAVVGAYYLARLRGDTLVAPSPAPGTVPFGNAETPASADALLHVLVALVVVIVAARVLGTLFRRLAQPPVVGEILAGILLGPSLLGRVAPAISAYLLPPTVAPLLNVLSQVGVILYMFLVGLDLDPSLLRKRGQTTLAISQASIAAPLVAGLLLALVLYPRVATADVPFSCFALFVGVSMSVTAFPVLARILTDRRIHRSNLGTIALTCAAMADVSAWCLLALVVSVVQARMSGALITLGMTAAFIAGMALVVRPLMGRLALFYGTRGHLTQGMTAIVFVALLASALATELIGIHAVFGAFALGAVIPHDSGLARELTDRLEDLVVVLLLPAFFAYTGLHTQIGLVTGGGDWLLCAAIVLVASVAKFGGSVVAARLTGLGLREASAIGILMNTRGLMELIVLDLGLELGVISPRLFAMLVVMALVTTLATTPLFHLVTRHHPIDVAPVVTAPSPSGPLGVARPGGVLVPVSNPVGVPALVDLALAATRPGDPAPRVLALVRRPGGGVRSGLRELDEREEPRAPILLAALDHAHERGVHVDVQAVWTDDPASDILDRSEDPRVGWLLLGFHRPVFGADLMGGVVKEVLERSAGQRAHVGVVVHGHQRPIDRVIAVVDASRDGRAALDFASRIALRRECGLHAVLVPQAGSEPEPELQEMLKEAARVAGRWLHTDVLLERNPAQLAYKTQGELVVIGVALVDELGLPLDDVPGAERCVVVVQGGADEPPTALSAGAGASGATAVPPTATAG